MDISKWNLSKVMQLPDWCFGEKWWVGDYMGSTGGLAYYRLGEIELPLKMVVWGVLVSARSPSCLEALRLTIRMGGSLPSAVGQVNALERVLKRTSTAKITYELYVNQNGVTWINIGRQYVEANGRHLVMLANGDQSIAYEMTVAILISAIPKEIPDWFVKAG